MKIFMKSSKKTNVALDRFWSESNYEKTNMRQKNFGTDFMKEA